MPIKLVASDLDGTIIDENNQIAEDNLSAIQNMNQKNIGFAICTGKTYPIIKKQCKDFKASYGIFGNGIQIVDLKTGKELYKQLLAKEEISLCLSIARKENLHVHLYTEDQIITESLKYMDLRNYILKKNHHLSDDLKFTFVDNIQKYIEENTIPIFKLIISSDHSLHSVKEKIEKELNVTIINIKKYGNYKDLVINKEYEYLDITPPNTSKSEALHFLTSYLNVKQEEVMAIGDNLNDIDMIKHSGVGVAVANAYEELKQIATYTTTNSVENGGFAEAIQKYVIN